MHAYTSLRSTFCKSGGLGWPFPAPVKAPEILANKGHGKAVDWWSMGTLIFELMCGLPPFYDTNQNRMYSKIQSASLAFPSKVKISDQGKDFIQRILTRKVDARLGSKGEEQVKGHQWFVETTTTGLQPLDWVAVLKKETKPEHVPPKAGAGNFDVEFTSEKAIDSVVSGALSDAQQEKTKFQGFTYAEDTLGS